MSLPPPRSDDSRGRRGFAPQRSRSALALLAAALVLGVRAEALPPGFVETTVGGTWTEVSALAFSSDGTRIYVVERGGKVWIVENGVKLPTPFLDISDEVGAWRDFGMLGFALHPNFEQNGFVYAFYVVDRYYLFNHGTPGYNPALLESQQLQATIGRLSRFTADLATGRTTVLPGSQVVLLGQTPSEGMPILHQSHGTGQVVFGQDGTLLVSTGDGASYDITDTGSGAGTYYAQALADGIIQPWENVGSWRSQQVDSLNGKILRIDPLTGTGVPSNPFYEPTAPRSTRSRVWAVGLRNPYRFTLRPGSGTHDPADGDPGSFYIGDVGWNNAEDMHVMTGPGQNFGWPAFEGINQQATSTTDSPYWNADTPNPRTKNPLAGQPGCSIPFLRFRDLIVQESSPPAPAPSWPNPCNPSMQIPDTWTDPSNGTVYRYDKFEHSRPPISWRGNAWVSTFDAAGNPTFETMGSGTPVQGPNFSGFTSTGGVWYTGTDFPEEWQNTYFHGDYGVGWIKSFGFDANDQLIDVVDFVDPGSSVTFIGTNPVTGGIYYVNWGDTVSEVRWVGTGNTPPTAVALPAASWSTGSQLSVQFSGASSSDPDPGAVLSYLWDFGDGATSTAPNPVHNFVAAPGAPQNFVVQLTVTDEDAHSDVATALVSLNNSPPTAQITAPADGSLYTMVAPTLVSLASNVSDAQQPAGTLTCSVLVELVHNSHTHQEPLINACSANVEITPVGCDGNTYSWRFTLSVADSQGLVSTDSVSMLPDCSTVPNGPPSALPDTTTVVSGKSIAIPVLSNDFDLDGILVPSSVAITSPPSSGIVEIDPGSGAITYTHDGSGTSDQFSYTVDDDDGATSNEALVSLAVVPNVLVASYGFEEAGGSSVTDASGNGNNGTLVAVTRTGAGRFGSALVFNGTNALVTIPDSNSLDLTTAMTLEAWVYPTASGGWRDVIYKGPNDQYYLEGSSFGSGAPAVGGNFSPSPLYSLGGQLPLSTWSHLAATYDNAVLRLYVDGVQVASRLQTGPIQTSTGALTLGGDLLYGQYFAGRIDEVRIYGRALSQAEIQQDMQTAVALGPVAVADAASLAEGGSTVINLAANDTAPAGLDLDSIEIASGPSHGSIAIHPNGTVTYTHDGGETTSDSFSYTIRDVPGAPSNAATVSLTVTPVNDAPVAQPDDGSVAEGNAVPIALASNDSDPEGQLDLGSIEIASQPANGSVVVTGGGSVTYTHDGGETTSDSFSYTIRDVPGAPSNAATVSLSVTPVNDAPVAGDDAAEVVEGGSVLIGLTANDSDPENALDPGSIEIVSGAAHGSVSIVGGGDVLYEHDGSNGASDAFTYTIRDTSGTPSAAATVSVSVNGVPEVPALPPLAVAALATALLAAARARRRAVPRGADQDLTATRTASARRTPPRSASRTARRADASARERCPA
jgi:glucose/arabinose dehydrogenase